MHIWVRVILSGQVSLIDPKLVVESISEVPGASKAHLDVVNGGQSPNTTYGVLVHGFNTRVSG